MLCQWLNTVSNDTTFNLKALRSAKLSLKKAINSANRSWALPEKYPNRNHKLWPRTIQMMGVGASKSPTSLLELIPPPSHIMANPHSSRTSKLPKATTLGSGLDQALLPSFDVSSITSIPELINNTCVSVEDVNSVLFVLDELALPDKAETLMASVFPVWLATKLSQDDHDRARLHNTLTALCRFCDFPPAGYDPQPYTAVSPVPPGTILPPALSPTRVTDDRDIDTDSNGGPPAAPVVPMTVPARASTEHLRTPTPQPERKGKMKEAPLHLTAKPAPAPKAPPPTLSAPQKAPTSYAVAAAMSKPAKPASQGAGKAKAQTSAKPPKPTPPPPRPSLMLSLIGHTLDMTLKMQAGVLAPGLVGVRNDALASIPTFASVRVSACRWTPKGNLVVFAGPDTSRDQLSATSHLLTSAIAASLPNASACVSSRLNVCWGKVLVNGVPTGVTDDSSAAHSPSVCLQDLLDNNPSLHPLKVTQMPSWVQALRLFQPGSSSSLVFGFEDPDGTIAPSLIAARHLFCFGACITVRRWRQPPPSHRSRVAKPAAPVLQGPSAATLVVAGTAINPEFGPPGPGPPLPGASGQKHDLCQRRLGP